MFPDIHSVGCPLGILEMVCPLEWIITEQKILIIFLLFLSILQANLPNFHSILHGIWVCFKICTLTQTYNLSCNSFYDLAASWYQFPIASPSLLLANTFYYLFRPQSRVTSIFSCHLSSINLCMWKMYYMCTIVYSDEMRNSHVINLCIGKTPLFIAIK